MSNDQMVQVNDITDVGNHFYITSFLSIDDLWYTLVKLRRCKVFVKGTIVVLPLQVVNTIK